MSLAHPSPPFLLLLFPSHLPVYFVSQQNRPTPGLPPWSSGKDVESTAPEDRHLSYIKARLNELSHTRSVPSFKLTNQVVLLPCSELGCEGHQLLFSSQSFGKVKSSSFTGLQRKLGYFWKTSKNF